MYEIISFLSILLVKCIEGAMEHETIDGDKHTWLDGRSIKRVRAYNEKYLFFKKSDGCSPVMEGYQGLEAAALLNVHRQSVSTYVNHFNQGGMDQLLKRKSAPGRSPYLSATEEEEVKRWLTESTPAKEGFGPSLIGTRVFFNTFSKNDFRFPCPEMESLICFIAGVFATQDPPIV